MLNLLTTFAYGFTLGVSIAIVPGPHMAMLIYCLNKEKVRGGIYFILGTLFAMFVWGIMLIKLIEFLNSLRLLEIIIGFISACLLIFFGAKDILFPSQKESSNNLRIFEHSFFNGVIVSFFNPTSFIWFSTIGLKVIWDLKREGHIYLVSYVLGFILAIIGTLGILIYLFEFTKTGNKYKPMFTKIGAAIFLCFGIFFFIQSIKLIM